MLKKNLIKEIQYKEKNMKKKYIRTKRIKLLNYLLL